MRTEEPSYRLSRDDFLPDGEEWSVRWVSLFAAARVLWRLGYDLERPQLTPSREPYITALIAIYVDAGWLQSLVVAAQPEGLWVAHNAKETWEEVARFHYEDPDLFRQLRHLLPKKLDEHEIWPPAFTPDHPAATPTAEHRNRTRRK